VKVEFWSARDAEQSRRWASVQASMATRPVFAHPSLVAQLAGPEEQPMAAYAQVGSAMVLYPFLLRPLAAGPATGALPRQAGAPRPCDITSPYGYGGAYTDGRLDPADAREFWRQFDQFCADRGVVSEFTRLSLFADERLAHPGDTTSPLTNVVVDLTVSEDELWRRFEHKVRKNVAKARRSGVTVELDPAGGHLDAFLAIYEATMDRRDAAAGYYFPRSFFEEMLHSMRDQFMFFHSWHDGRIVSTELVLASTDTLYSFLGGTDEAAFPVRPNDLLKFEVCRWGMATGRRRFVLGGGRSRDDGIFRYKRSFAPNGLIPFEVSRRVHDAEAYARHTAAHHAQGRRRDPQWQPDPEFFPAYRCPLPAAGNSDGDGDGDGNGNGNGNGEVPGAERSATKAVHSG
jgi:hypothetical protein